MIIHVMEGFNNKTLQKSKVIICRASFLLLRKDYEDEHFLWNGAKHFGLLDCNPVP